MLQKKNVVAEEEMGSSSIPENRESSSKFGCSQSSWCKFEKFCYQCVSIYAQILKGKGADSYLSAETKSKTRDIIWTNLTNKHMHTNS